MPGGRPPKPLAFHEMTGGTKKNPQRFLDRKEPDTPGPIGDPPADFLGTAGNAPKLLGHWKKLIAEAPIGLLTISDSEYLATVCRVWLLTTYEWKGRRQALKDYAAMLKGLGMTPEGRAIRGMGGKATREGDEQSNKLRAFQAARAKHAS